jgi:indoleamine 2,3-dioxygenase
MKDTTNLLGTVGTGSRARGHELLTTHGISPTHGFLAGSAVHLPPEFARWERIAVELPYLLTSGRLRGIADGLPPLDVEALDDVGQQRRAHLLLSFMAGAYRCAESTGARIPSGIAVPWNRIARRLGRPAATTYASVVLENWTVEDDGPFEPERLRSQILLTGSDDECWLYRIAAVAEQRGARTLRAVSRLFQDLPEDDPGPVREHLHELQESLRAASVILRRLPERCAPARLDGRVACFLAEWTGVSPPPVGSRRAPAVSPLQSPFLQTADAALGIAHIAECRRTIRAQRSLMPPAPRRLIEVVEGSLHLRAFVRRHSRDAGLRQGYNGCVDALAGLRAVQSRLARSYLPDGEGAVDDQANDPGGRLQALAELMRAATREAVL